MPAEAFNPDRPEFSPDVPRKLRGSGERVEAFNDDDVPTLQDSDLSMGRPDRGIVIPGPSRGVVTQLRANPNSKSSRSENVQTPPPLQKPLTKKASLPVPEMVDELAEMVGSLQKVDMTKEASEVTAAPPPDHEKDAAAAKRSKDSSFFSSSFATPAELDKTLIDKYGIEWIGWMPETLWQTIREDFKTQISRLNQEKISAAMLLHVSDSFWKHWETFEKVVLAFNNVVPHFDRHQELTVGQMLHAVMQAHEIRKEVFDPEVLSYISAMAKDDGFLWLPAPLDVAQARLDQLNPAEMVPLKKEIRDRWDAFQDLDLRDVEFKEDVYGIHLAKLAAIDLYLKSMSSPELSEEL